MRRTISQQVALILYRLQSGPCRIDHLARSLFNNEAQNRIAAMIFDGIIEVELDGRFVSGPEVFVISDKRPNGMAETCVDFSRQAIEYAIGLEGLSIGETATRLYLYNRIPLNPTLARKLRSTDLFSDFICPDRETRLKIGDSWPRMSAQDAWMQWRTNSSTDGNVYKLYLSPLVEDFPTLFEKAIFHLIEIGCECFKVGRTLMNLSRPDKFVAYFSTFEALRDAAIRIQESLDNVRVHGVPFSGKIDSLGIVSWGMDPPMIVGSERGSGASWRYWVAQRLALHIHVAKETSSDNTVEHALGRISLDGIDVKSWSPNLAIWNSCIR